MKPYNTRVIVNTAGQPVRLSNAPLKVKAVTIAAIPTNTTRVCIGNYAIRARDGEQNGLPMMGGSRPDMNTPPYPETDLYDLWVDAATAGEGVVVQGWTE